VGVKKPNFLHGKTLYLGTSYPVSTVSEKGIDHESIKIQLCNIHPSSF
jgi:hypothetical protein